MEYHVSPGSLLFPGSCQTDSLNNRRSFEWGRAGDWTLLRGHFHWHCKAFFLPARMPLVTPGIPCISETLLLVKYSSQVAFRYSESQKDLQSLVVTVSLSISMTFAQTSYPLESSVRFPRRQTLERKPRKVLHSQTSHYQQQKTGDDGVTHGKTGGSRAVFMTPA